MQRGLTLAEKIVLLALADRADEADSCFPSVATISEDTGADRKTVMAAMRKVEVRGLVEVRRLNGAGNRYHLIGVEHRTSPKNGTGTSFGTGTKNGTAPVPKTGPPPVPKTGHEPTNEPTTNQPRKARGKKWQLPAWVEPAAWEEFEAHRRDIRKPMTDLARTKNAEVLKGLSHEQQRVSINASIANRWTGLFPPKPAAGGRTRHDDRAAVNALIDADLAAIARELG